MLPQQPFLYQFSQFFATYEIAKNQPIHAVIQYCKQAVLRLLPRSVAGRPMAGRGESQDVAISMLRSKGINARIVTLVCGDVLWVAQSRANPSLQYVLDFVVERKRVDDLAGSIKDTRRAAIYFHV